MNRNMAVLSLFVASYALASSGEAWIHEAPSELPRVAEVLSSKQYREVEVSRIETAESELAQQSFVSLSEDRSHFYTDEPLMCVAPSRPFLVRAVVGHRSTGGFYVQRLKSSLFITHSSLGHSTPKPTKSALVICTDRVSEVFVTFGVAE